MKRKSHYSSEDSPLSPEEMEMLRRNIAAGEDRSKLPPHDTSDRANAVRFAKKNPSLIVAIVIISVCVVAALAAGAFFGIRAVIREARKTSDYTVYLGSESYTVDYDDAVRDGVLFIDMRRVAEFSEMIISGSKDRIKFTSNNENYLIFENNSEFAVINGSTVQMTALAIVNEDECLIPFNFLQRAVGEGLRIRIDDEMHTIKISRQLYIDTHEPALILFSTNNFTIIESLKKEEEELPMPEYDTDITAYLQYIDPADASAYLILANKQNALGRDYTPSDLVVLQTLGIDSKDAGQQLCSAAAQALRAMISEMEADGVDMTTDRLFVTSSYRSYEYQEMLYNRYVSDNISAGMSQAEAEAEASKTSARPGESEHQTGLCFDFIVASMGGSLDERFENTPAFEWLSKNAHHFGFILRYPEDKVAITGYDYEPWHYRFVGRTAAMEIYHEGLSLEEYLDPMRKNDN